MRIFAYYLENLDINTGTPIRARNTIKFLSRRERVIVAAQNLSSQEILSKIDFYPIKKYSYLKGLNFFFKIRDLKKIIKESQPDILYGFDCNSVFALGIVGRALKIPVVVELHGAGHYGLDPNIFWRYALGFFEKMIFKYVDGIVAVCSSIKDYYLNVAGNSALPAKVIYGGADIDFFNPQAPIAPEMQELRKKGKIIIGYIGNFKSYQGVDFLIESALEIGDNFIYALVGKDSEGLRSKIAQRGLQDKVFILGRKKSEDIPSYLRGMDIMAIPRPSNAITEYAIPSKLAEYMASGKAIVATAVGGAVEIIRDRETGILIPPTDIPKNLAESFALLGSNPELMQKIGNNAFEFARNSLSWDKLFDQLINFLYELHSKYYRK